MSDANDQILFINLCYLPIYMTEAQKLQEHIYAGQLAGISMNQLERNSMIEKCVFTYNQPDYIL
jgi:hypothetical protein